MIAWRSSPSELKWARLQADVQCGLRRGAWYQVISLTPHNAVISVNAKPLPMPRTLLEIHAGPPRRWTVLRHPMHSPKVPSRLRYGYAVCPECHHRTALPKRKRTLDRMRCAWCSEVSEIAWDERYLEPHATDR